MKLIFTQYLASLRERGELDVILPDLLSEMGLHVLSRPMRGTRQHGVDVAAVGKVEKGEKCLYLLSIKPGDLKRTDWDYGPQALRQSLNEILDAYIPSHIPTAFRHLPIIIVPCIGGEMREDVQENVIGFTEDNSSENVSFEIWTGDTLAGHLLTGVLGADALPDSWRSDLRKSIALVDEPQESFSYFRRFVTNVADAFGTNAKSRLTALRQIHIALWTLYVWSRDVDNTEGAYLSSELAILIGWSLARDNFEGTSKLDRQLRDSIVLLITLHCRIADHYIDNCVVPYAQALHGLSSRVPSSHYLDVNLRLFKTVARLAARGLWILEGTKLARQLDQQNSHQNSQSILQGFGKLIRDIIANNPILCTPISDWQAEEINVTCLFLHRIGWTALIKSWIEQISRATMFAYQTHQAYPCVYKEYQDLVGHPRDGSEYRSQATAASRLLPTLAVWASIVNDTDTLECLSEFAKGPYTHSALQVWFPGSDTEAHLYRGNRAHGLSAINVQLPSSRDEMLSQIAIMCSQEMPLSKLSAMKPGFEPLIIVASLHHGVPVPPQLWPFVRQQA